MGERSITVEVVGPPRWTSLFSVCTAPIYVSSSTFSDVNNTNIVNQQFRGRASKPKSFRCVRVSRLSPGLSCQKARFPGSVSNAVANFLPNPILDHRSYKPFINANIHRVMEGIIGRLLRPHCPQ